jgi:hypothetical protein
MRFSPNRVSRPVEGVSDDNANAAARAAGITGFEVRRVGARSVVRARAVAARSMEVNGDMTAWQPRTMLRAAGGWWEIEMELTPGTHEIAVRVDGGSWHVPPGLTPLTDEFGGTVGVLVVR